MTENIKRRKRDPPRKAKDMLILKGPVKIVDRYIKCIGFTQTRSDAPEYISLELCCTCPWFSRGPDHEMQCSHERAIDIEDINTK